MNQLNQLILFLFLPGLLFAQKTEIRYLSGTGADHTVNWEFFCSAGMNSGKWTTIAVPSCWEQQGFGAYNFGRDPFEGRLNETGTYKYRFTVPSSWKGKQVNIVFDGVMTDAEVKINGKLAGPVHQGAFYRFNYDISKLVRTGQKNELEVFVKKQSDNLSVSHAERGADYWVFGGIFRPVYLEAKPLENIDRVAVDARANGNFTGDVYLSGLKNAAKVVAEIQTPDGTAVVRFETGDLSKVTRITGNLAMSQTWSPEFPNLYNVTFNLVGKNGRIIHQMSKRIGFRTVEVRESDGVYVNGVCVKLKGVCRHTFHPKYGRTSCKAFSIEDVNLMKDMNINAVRMSHYPPDEHFLDVCDSLGLFVIDELTAWQEPSPGSALARNLLEDMIARDVNHPSVILWDNGNEGGENRNLDNAFAELDIQKRKVLHPWQDYDLINTLHYIDYNYLSLDGFSRRKIFLPTEFLHGLHDGGLGAGLDDYWQKMWSEPLCSGGFLWVFADESVERTDRNREPDPHGNYAPDGILGPYHEKEGSFYTIREIWSPVYIEKRYITPEFNGTFRIENRYFFTNLSQCSFTAEWIKLKGPDEDNIDEISGREELKVDLAPGQKGVLNVTLPADWETLDVLRIKLVDTYGRHLNTWTWPLKYPGIRAMELLTETKTATEKPVIRETEQNLVVNAQGVIFSFRKTDGTIQQVATGGQTIPLSNGPVFVSREKSVKQVTHRFEGNDLFIETLYENGDWNRWTIRGNGLLDLEVAYEPADNCLFAGITFDLPEENVAGMKWLGNGPYRVYKNRMKGTEFGIWEKAYNNSVTGESGFVYPEFKGYYSNIYWVKVLGNNIPDFKVYIRSNDVFLRMLTPQEPEYRRNTTIVYPKGDLSFLHGISAIGTKFTEPDASGPQSFPYYFNPVKIHERKLSMKLTFDFRSFSCSVKEPDIKTEPLSKVPKHHFFGYYGINPWDSSGRYHLALETDFDNRKPESDDVAKVGVIDKETSGFIPFGETSAFNFQQGSMMHWIDAGFGEEFTYNAYENDKLISYAVNFKTKEKRKIDGAIAAVSPNLKEGIGLNFDRMSYCRSVVGYAHHRKDYKLVNIPGDDGLFSLNLETGEKKLMVSIKEVIEKSDYDLPLNRPAWFNHVLYNASGKRILFFCRIQNQDGTGFLSSLWTINSDGSNLQNQIPFGYRISHFDWKDDKTILVTTDIPGHGLEYVEFTDGKKDFRPVGRGILTIDGHCSYSPDAKWILTDTYPKNEKRLTRLFLYHIAENKLIPLGEFHHPEIYTGDIRCDLHPRFSKDGKTITFDSVHEGIRKIYLIDVKDLMKRP